jgi:NAD(P)-dependent dehydrogenase (short-subunit alcohol dehydrogenase family)
VSTNSDPVRAGGLVVITGAGSGIGRAVAHVVAGRWPDSRLALLDREEEGLATLLGEIGPERAVAQVVDVSDDRAVQLVFERVAAIASRPVTGLVTCAGVQLKRASLDLTPAEWHAVLAVHLDGTLYCCQAAARQMRDAGGGSIVTLSSVAQEFAWPARLPYAVAKAGIAALSRTLAVEWAELGIRVNAIAPGYVMTPLLIRALQSGEVVEDVAPLHALNRLAEPVEIARAILYLLSEDASFVTGETLFVDGGFHVRKVSW